MIASFAEGIIRTNFHVNSLTKDLLYKFLVNVEPWGLAHILGVRNPILNPDFHFRGIVFNFKLNVKEFEGYKDAHVESA